MEYRVTSIWAGYWGGWGSESYIQQIINDQAQQGWRLSRTEGRPAFWFWLIPRWRLLLIFERQAGAV